MTAESVQLRYLAEVVVSNVDKKSNDLDSPVRLVNYTDVYYNRDVRPSLDLMPATATSEQITRFRVQPGDTIITKDSETASDIAVSAYVADAAPDMVCGYHLALLRPRAGVDPRFLFWALNAQQTRDKFSVAANGMTRFGLTYDAIQGVTVPVPLLDEQRRIADFLDDQVNRIDDVVAARKAQVATLTHALSAAAFDAVTGAQNPGPTRRSKLPWVSEMPESWGEPRICQVAKMGTGHTPSRSVEAYWLDCTIPWLTTGDVYRFRHDEIDHINDTVLRISEVGVANSAAVVHPAGTVALSRTASAGFSIVMDVPMATSQDYATWTPGPQLLSDYLLWCLRVMRADVVGRLAIGSTHKTIYFPDLMSIRVPLPSLQEQRDAIARIQEASAWVAQGRSALGASVQQLGELKTSLIAAAVSGEFDVSVASGRGVA